MIAKAKDVRIVFGVDWHGGNVAKSSYIGAEWALPLASLAEPLRQQVEALAQEAAKQVEEPGS